MLYSFTSLLKFRFSEKATKVWSNRTSRFFSNSRWNSGIVYWHQHNQSSWNHLLVTTPRNKKRRLDNGSWFFLFYSIHHLLVSYICGIYTKKLTKFFILKRTRKNFNVFFLFPWNKCNFPFYGIYVLILNWILFNQ